MIWTWIGLHYLELMQTLFKRHSSNWETHSGLNKPYVSGWSLHVIKPAALKYPKYLNISYFK